MSIEYSYGKTLVESNEDYSIFTMEKSEDGYRWKEVTVETEKESFFAGSYYTYNYSSSVEHMRYNSEYIVIISKCTMGYDHYEPVVASIFDLKTMKFIDASRDELMNIYKSSFEGQSLKREKK